MSDNYYEIHAENLSHFKQEARKAFATICNTFEFQEENVTLSDTANLFQITFSTKRIRIIVEGINWGMNTDVHVGINEAGAALYNIHQLLKERKPEKPVSGSQVDQLYGYANYLLTHAADILRGDTGFFNWQEAIKKQQEEVALKTHQEEIANKLAEGYIMIDSTYYGDIVWRKPRPSLSPFKVIKDKYPDSIEVIFNENDIISGGNAPTIILSWEAELDSTVKKDSVICFITTDMVWFDLVAPQTGKLVWLLEEGIPLNAPTCIALIIPVKTSLQNVQSSAPGH